MKKTALVLSLCLIVLLLASCGKSIALTPENINEYLDFRLHFSNKHTSYFMGQTYMGNSLDINYQTYSKKAGSFDGVEITVKFPNSHGYALTSSDREYKENQGDQLSFSFSLPSDGRHSETRGVHTSVYGSIEESDYEIVSVTGNFIPN